uniref:Uncharacterized protein n=1 Tax=Hyaloperonospora arabidopsidis (strain Emoy2) TaxID=559515 RepID=M4BVL0_HYAAE
MTCITIWRRETRARPSDSIVEWSYLSKTKLYAALLRCRLIVCNSTRAGTG